MTLFRTIDPISFGRSKLRKLTAYHLDLRRARHKDRSEGRSRLSLIGRAGALPAAGSQVRLATKYPNTARRMLEGRSWGAEIVRLSGSVELAPLLDLAELALDIVQTGRTLVENDLVEIEPVAEVAACLVVNRASYQRHRARLNEWIGRLEAAEVAA